jgi:hypothetical protein
MAYAEPTTSHSGAVAMSDTETQETERIEPSFSRSIFRCSIEDDEGGYVQSEVEYRNGEAYSVLLSDEADGSIELSYPVLMAVMNQLYAQNSMQVQRRLNNSPSLMGAQVGQLQSSSHW